MISVILCTLMLVILAFELCGVNLLSEGDCDCTWDDLSFVSEKKCLYF